MSYSDRTHPVAKILGRRVGEFSTTASKYGNFKRKNDTLKTAQII